jgi:hypothetical protein
MLKNAVRWTGSRPLTLSPPKGAGMSGDESKPASSVDAGMSVIIEVNLDKLLFASHIDPISVI